MENTLNYNLKKPKPTDKVKIQDINENMDIIDVEINKKAEKAQINSLAGTGRTTETVKKNADDIGNLSEEMAELTSLLYQTVIINGDGVFDLPASSKGQINMRLEARTYTNLLGEALYESTEGVSEIDWINIKTLNLDSSKTYFINIQELENVECVQIANDAANKFPFKSNTMGKYSKFTVNTTGTYYLMYKPIDANTYTKLKKILVEVDDSLTADEYLHMYNFINETQSTPAAFRIKTYDKFNNYKNVYPIPCKAGLFGFEINGADNVLWVFPDGTTSSEDYPGKILDEDGTVFLFCDNFAKEEICINDHSTNDRYLGDLSDLPPLTYYLRLYGCKSITGDLSNLPPLTYYLNLLDCENITGDLSDLPPLTYYLSLEDCYNITGDLSDLPPLTYYLSLEDCHNITGDLSDLPRLTYSLSLEECYNITGDLSDLPQLTYRLSLEKCSKITGYLSDLPSLTYSLNLRDCYNITGDLLDLPPLTYLLNLEDCSNITGDLSNLPPLTYYLNLDECSSITGDLSDLPPLTYYLRLSGCSNITGILNPTPEISKIYLDYTNLSADDVDQTIINLANNNTEADGTLSMTNLTRTSASDSAYAELQGRGWTILGV